MRHWIIVLALLTGLIGVGQVDAAVFTGGEVLPSDYGSGTFDGIESAGLEAEISKQFTGMGPIDTVFTLDPNQSLGYLLKIEETITNNTGLVWGDYHFQIGTGSGESFVAAAGDGLSFTSCWNLRYDPYPTGDLAFQSNLQNSPDGLGWDGWDFWNGTVQPNGTVIIGFQVADTGNNDTFTLRQYPTIPEPATLMIWSLLGLVSLGAYGWRRRSGAWRKGTTESIHKIIDGGRG